MSYAIVKMPLNSLYFDPIQLKGFGIIIWLKIGTLMYEPLNFLSWRFPTMCWEIFEPPALLTTHSKHSTHHIPHSTLINPSSQYLLHSTESITFSHHVHYSFNRPFVNTLHPSFRLDIDCCIYQAHQPWLHPFQNRSMVVWLATIKGFLQHSKPSSQDPVEDHVVWT